MGGGVEKKEERDVLKRIKRMYILPTSNLSYQGLGLLSGVPYCIEALKNNDVYGVMNIITCTLKTMNRQ